MTNTTKKETNIAPEANEAVKDDYVEVMIPLDMMNPEDDVLTVTINGENFRIRRGIRVMVPRRVYELLVFKRKVM